MRHAALISGSYLVLGCAWIVGSDLALLPGDDIWPRLVSMGKGLGFITVTAILLFGALVVLFRREARLSVRLSETRLHEALERQRRDGARQLLSRIVEATSDRVWIIDAAHRVHSGNAAAWASIGRPPAEEPVALVDAGWPDAYRAAIAGLVDATIAGEGKSGEGKSGRLVYEQGPQRRTIDYVMSRIEDPETGEPRVLLLAHDVTDLIEAEEGRQRANRILKAVVASLSAINATRDRKLLAEQVTRALCRDGGFDAAWIAVATDDEVQPLAPIAADGASLDALRRLVCAAAVAPDQRPSPLTAVRTAKVAVFGEDLAATPFAGAGGFGTAVTFPLIVAGKPLATLTIHTRAVTRLSAEEIAPLATLAENLAYAFTGLDSLVRYEESEAGRLAAMSRVKGVLIQTIGALAGVVEVRDPYTAGHQQRVATLSTAIARRKGWADERIEGLRLGALIHDIGKIGIPAELLVKPGRLTAEEFALIKTHAARGGEMIRELRFDWPIFDMVMQHHERLDGSGYPARLRDNEIIPEAKIIAVADVVDAMLWHRPYRASKTIAEVVVELTTGRGVLYETEAVDVCLTLLAERGLGVFEDAEATRPAVTA